MSNQLEFPTMDQVEKASHVDLAGRGRIIGNDGWIYTLTFRPDFASLFSMAPGFLPGPILLVLAGNVPGE